MARRLREKSGTGIYHVMLRGINRQDILEDEEDYMRMTSILRGQSERYDEQGMIRRTDPVIPADLKKDFPSADYVGNNRYVFNIRGNNYRTVVLLVFFAGTVAIRFIGTHKEYDKIKDIKTI